MVQERGPYIQRAARNNAAHGLAARTPLLVPPRLLRCETVAARSQCWRGATLFSTTSEAQPRKHQHIVASAPAASSLRRHPIKLERYRED